MNDRLKALTEKEKETLRLVVRGYDAKSMARHFGLSVHTINERLRYARRKMEVSSSREAARMLLAREGGVPNSLADKEMGEAGPEPDMRHDDAPEGSKARTLLAWIIGGALIMSLVIAAMLLVSPTQIAQSAGFAPGETTSPAELAGSEAVQSARKWLALVDEGRWSDSRDAAGQSFKSLNTSEEWASVSEGFRPRLGAVLSRTAVSEETVVAPPNGYRTIEFRTQFSNLPDARETVTLEREGGDWKVVGYMIDG